MRARRLQPWASERHSSPGHGQGRRGRTRRGREGGIGKEGKLGEKGEGRSEADQESIRNLTFFWLSST